MRQICDYEQCFGCCSCYNICPKGAIFMDYDEWENLVPKIREEKCIECGLCQKVCPAIHESDFHFPQKVYAAITKDEEDYASTSSGGVATVFSKYVLHNRGVVYGAAFINGSAEVKHIRVESLDDLKQLKGSKYTQSNIGDSFKSVKEDLNLGYQVLFIGTPCQTDGLQMYLGKEYKKLITVNLICHGCPSNFLFREHIEKLCEEKNDLQISFRNNQEWNLTIKRNEKKLYSKAFYKDHYFLGFMRKLFYRNSCYICKYAQPKRVGDITIGDFWGFNEEKPFPVEHSKGLSVVLINTRKGKEFFDSVKDRLVFQERKAQEAIKGNPQLIQPSKRNINFYRFRKLYKKYGFDRASKKILWIYQIAYVLNFIFQKIKQSLIKGVIM